MQLVVTNKKRTSSKARVIKSLRALSFFIFAWLLPVVAIANEPAKKLSLQDAIHLSLRENPNVQIIKLSETISRFGVKVAEWRFKPHYGVSASINNEHISALPELSLLTPYGTEIKAKPRDINSRHPDERLSVS